MPSRFEPCGLTQMYSLRYGTVPVVRATGGPLRHGGAVDPATGRGTGFRFDNPDGTGLMWALDQALNTIKDRAAWRRSSATGWRRTSRGPLGGGVRLGVSAGHREGLIG